MKRILLMLSTVLCSVGAQAQLSNADFENWDLTPYDVPATYWISSNYVTVPEYGEVTTTKVTGQASPNAIRLETKAVGSDFAFGFISNSFEDFESGEGGQPYNGTPTMFNGFYRYNLPNQDSAFIFVMFKQGGVVVSSDTLKIKGSGSQTTFTPFTLPLTLAVTPDSVIIVAVSSNVLDGTYAHVENGSWLELDNLMFTGGFAPPIPNGNFEIWTARSMETPEDWRRGGMMWDSFEATIKRSTDKHGGSYAAKLVSAIDSVIDLSEVMPGAISAITELPSVAGAVDTLVGYYKYTTTGTDTAAVQLVFVNGPSTVATYMQPLPAVATYTMFKVPLLNKAALSADSVMITFLSSGYTSATGPFPVAVNGSTLLIDDLDIKQYVVGINEVEKQAVAYSVYPNPAKNVLNISLNAQRAESVRISLVDAKGSVVYTADNTLVPGTALAIPVSQLAPGMYFYSIKGANGEVTDKFYKD